MEVTSRRNVKLRIVPCCAESGRAGRRTIARERGRPQDHGDDGNHNDDERDHAPIRPGSVDGGSSQRPPEETALVRFPLTTQVVLLPHLVSSPRCVLYPAKRDNNDDDDDGDGNGDSSGERLLASPTSSLPFPFPDNVLGGETVTPSSSSSVVYSVYRSVVNLSLRHAGVGENRLEL